MQEFPFKFILGWFQILIDCEFPILYLFPWLTTTYEACILHHIKLGLCPSWASKKFPFGKYFALRTFVTVVSLLVINLQPCCPIMTRLKAWRCLKPKPPNSFFIDSFSHLIQLMPWEDWLLLPPPKRIHHFFSRSSCKVDGNKKTLIQYDGIDWANDFMRTSLPALEKNLVDQWLIWFQNLSFRKPKNVFFLLRMINSSPKYFPVPIV